MRIVPYEIVVMSVSLKSLFVVVLVLASVCVCGCRYGRAGKLVTESDQLRMDNLSKVKPRTRIGTFASSTLATKFSKPEKLGGHSYGPSVSEKNGILYSCRGGHIDMAHLRNVADWTAHLSAMTYNELVNDANDFSFTLSEDTTCYVNLKYPKGWEEISQESKDAIVYDVSMGLGQYFAYQASIWHEILTWFGYKMTGFYSEFGSAFSWEDTYSNLLGCHIGYIAMYDKERSYNEAMTFALSEELEKLDVQPKQVAKLASNLVRGDWYSGEQPIVIMKGRNFDTGIDDGFVTPWIVPGVRQCQDADAVDYPVPGLEFLGQYGIEARFEIELKVWEKTKILKIIYPNGEKKKRFEPASQLAVVMDYIIKQADGKYTLQNGMVESK